MFILSNLAGTTDDLSIWGSIFISRLYDNLIFSISTSISLFKYEK